MLPAAEAMCDTQLWLHAYTIAMISTSEIIVSMETQLPTGIFIHLANSILRRTFIEKNLPDLIVKFLIVF